MTTTRTFDVVEEDTGIATLQCPDCGAKTTRLKSFVVASDEMTCSECGFTENTGSPHVLAAFVILLTAVVAEPVFRAWRWLKNKVSG